MIEFLSIFFIALALSFDTFAVSISTGVNDIDIEFKNAVNIAIILAFFQGIMPFIGWLAGSELEKVIGDWDHWISFALLVGLGLKMIYEGLKKNDESHKSNDLLNFKVVVGMALATSIDALIVGISFAFVEINIYISIIIIGAVTFFVSMLGILFGKKLGAFLGRKMDALGGLILIAIAIKILLSHL